eukprot:2161724-Alexandrium_andersonii.AAC.1
MTGVRSFRPRHRVHPPFGTGHCFAPSPLRGFCTPVRARIAVSCPSLPSSSSLLAIGLPPVVLSSRCA